MTLKENIIALGLSDLRLVMDNYQNIIQMSTILIEQQKQVLSIQKDISKKQEELSRQQYEFSSSLDNIVKKVDTYAERNSKYGETILETYGNMSTALLTNFKATDDKVDSLSLDTTSQIHKINNNIYLAMVGSGVIILSLISLVISVFDKNTLFLTVADQVQKIYNILALK